jgi:hypothetical protein
MSLAASLFYPGKIDCAPAVKEMALSFYEVISDEIIASAAQLQPAIREQDLRLDDDLKYAGAERCWMPELGIALELARQGGRSARDSWAQLALCNTMLGNPLDVAMDISAGTCLQFAGLRLPRAETLKISSDGVDALILAGEREFKFRRIGHRWEHDSSPTLLRKYAPGTDVVVTGGNCLDAAVAPPDDIPIESDMFPAAVTNIAEAFSIVEHVAPEYTLWTRQLIRQVHVLGDRVGTTKIRVGRSSPHRPGHISTTAQQTVIAQAETLIHESSHQHFYMLKLTHRVSKETVQQATFISPLNGKMRDISRYLLAYHVVANIMVFYSKATRDQNLDQDFIEERKNYLRPITLEYLDNLIANENLLTDQANDFWQPSKEMIRELCLT